MMKCILLTSDSRYLAEAAESFATRLFDVQVTWRHGRADKHLTDSVLDTVAKGETDYLFNFLSSVILPSHVLARILEQSINFHPAPPDWPGVGSASLALYRNDETFGVTAHMMTEQVDGGPIIRVNRFPILPADTCETLSSRAHHYALLQFYETLDQIARCGRPLPIAESWKRRAVTRKEFEKWMTLTVDDPPEEIRRKARALRHSRFPGPTLELAGLRFQIPPSGKI